MEVFQLQWQETWLHVQSPISQLYYRSEMDVGPFFFTQPNPSAYGPNPTDPCLGPPCHTTTTRWSDHFAGRAQDQAPEKDRNVWEYNNWWSPHPWIRRTKETCYASMGCRSVSIATRSPRQPSDLCYQSKRRRPLHREYIHEIRSQSLTFSWYNLAAIYSKEMSTQSPSMCTAQ